MTTSSSTRISQYNKRKRKEPGRTSSLLSSLKYSHIAAFIMTMQLLISQQQVRAASCDAGWYTLTTDGPDNNDCTMCPAGFYCTGAEETKPVECSAGTYSLPNSGSSSDCKSTCPAGYRCPSKGAIPERCPLGSYNDGSSFECSLCPAGSYCTETSISGSTSGGQYSPLGVLFAYDCMPGYKCPDGSGYPILCPLGSYSAQGASSCIECPSGSFCPSQFGEAYSCPAGFYTPETGQYECIGCPAGYECDGSSATACDPGYYSLEYMSACEQCPAGYFCQSVQMVPQPCPAGTTAEAGATSCNIVLTGYGLTDMNSDTTTACAPTQYQSFMKDYTPICRDCPGGFDCSGDYPVQCDAGKCSAHGDGSCSTPGGGEVCLTPFLAPVSVGYGYAPESFSVTDINGDIISALTIKQAQPGEFVNGNVIDDCTPGTFSVGNTDQCLTCPEGHFCPQTNMEPILCPVGYYSDAGATECTLCEAGYACVTPFYSLKVTCDTASEYSEEGSQFCLLCPPGFSCASSSSKPERCDLGYYSDNGVYDCTACPAGKACYGLTLETAIDCPAGFYSPEGEERCLICPGGYACSDKTSGAFTSGSTSIIECDDGYFSARGDMGCNYCPLGFQCPYKHLAFIENCPPGTFSLGGQQACIECPEHYTCDHKDQISLVLDGFFSPKGTNIALKCPAGWECGWDEGAVGTDPYLGLPGAGYARKCQEGFYSQAGSSACTECASMTVEIYQKTTDGTDALYYDPIDIGNVYCPFKDQEPQICPSGTYQDDNTVDGTGTTYCKPCPLGKWSSQTGECLTVQDGEFSPFSYLQPMTCTYGTYSKAGQTANTIWSQMCTFCQPGILCQNGETDGDITSSTSTACPAGHYCNAKSEFSASNSELRCPQGTFAREDGSSTPLTGQAVLEDACEFCPAGSYCDGVTKYDCPEGYYCPATTDFSTRFGTEFPCPAGTFRATVGATTESECDICTAGNYCPEGSAREIPAPPGTAIIDTGAKDWQDYLCPKGQYQDQMGQQTCNSCTNLGPCMEGSIYPQLCPPGYKFSNGGSQNLDNLQDCVLCSDTEYCPIYGTGQNALFSTIQTSIPASITYQSGYLYPAGTASVYEFPCPPGSYDPGSTTLASFGACTICPAGQACSQGTGTGGQLELQNCAPGHYCPEGTIHSRQFKCPGGYYSANVDNQADTDCTDCPAGFFCPPGSHRPYICPNGYKCPQNTDFYHFNACPEGTYTFTQESTSCDPCPLGYYCDQLMSPAGFDGAYRTMPQPCPIGTYASSTSTVTADATTATDNGVQGCTECSAGYYCPEPGSIAQTQCGYGYYSPPLSGECFECAPGYQCDQSQTLSLTDYESAICPEGSYCAGGAATTVTCADGHYCPAGTRYMMACPQGTYIPTGGAQNALSDCVDAPQGYYIDLRQTYEGQQVTVTYTDWELNECDEGHFCEAGSRSSQQAGCLPGYYQDTTGNYECIECTIGNYCPGKTINPIQCPAGQYCGAGVAVGTNCPTGTYGATPGLQVVEDCTDCDLGHYCSQSGLTKPEGLCDAGYRCYTKSTTPQPDDGIIGEPCIGGGFCPEGSYEQQNCPPGTYNGDLTQVAKSHQDCQSCPAGEYCSGTTSTTTDGPCSESFYCEAGSKVPYSITVPRGYYTAYNEYDYADHLAGGTGVGAAFDPQSDGVKEPIACPQGTYQDNDGQTGCKLCLEGFYCDEEATSDVLKPCPKGQYCQEGTITPSDCPIGTYNDVFHKISGDDCKSCPPGKYCNIEMGVEPTGDWILLRGRFHHCYPRG